TTDLSLLIPPHAVPVRRTAEDIRPTVAVHIVSEHVGAGLAEVGGVKSPWFAVIFFRLLPPTAGTDYIEPAIAVDVADSQTMREPAGSRDFLARLTRLADRVHFPQLRRIFAGREPAHLSLILLPWRLGAHDQDALTVAEQIDELGRFVTGAV